MLTDGSSGSTCAGIRAILNPPCDCLHPADFGVDASSPALPLFSVRASPGAAIYNGRTPDTARCHRLAAETALRYSTSPMAAMATAMARASGKPLTCSIPSSGWEDYQAPPDYAGKHAFRLR